MVRVSSPAKLRPWSELTAKMVMGVVPGLVKISGKSKGGLSKGGLGPKGAKWAKKGPFGAISALPPWLWGAEELVPIGPEKAPIGPEKVPICPEKARFRGKDFPPIFSENLGLKPPFVSPPLDFPKNCQRLDLKSLALWASKFSLVFLQPLLCF